jgi:hypothetical protein
MTNDDFSVTLILLLSVLLCYNILKYFSLLFN